jgi:RND superfamily putative drug exporter
VRHRWRVIAGWLVVVAALSALASFEGGAYRNDYRLPGTGSYQAFRLLREAAPRFAGDTDQLVAATRSGRLADPRVRKRVERLLARVRALPGVSLVLGPYGAPGHISRSGRIGYATVTFDVPAFRYPASEAARFDRTVGAASGRGMRFAVDGQIAESGLGLSSASSLAFGFAAAGVVLLAVFGSLPATLCALATAGLSLGAGIAVIRLASQLIEMADFSGQLALLIGLGVGVDYALFIVTRFRQAMLRGRSVEQAVLEALDTSGRAVLCAGAIVCLAMLGMFALGIGFLYGVAVAAAIGVAFTVIAALTVLPALLGVFGQRTLRRRERRAIAAGALRATDESAAWRRWAQQLQRRPRSAALVALALMALLAAPFFSMRLGSADAGNDPPGSITRTAYALLARGFGPGYNGPLELVARIRGLRDWTAFERVVRAAAATPGVQRATAPVLLEGGPHRPTVALAGVIPARSPEAAATAALLRRLRTRVIPEALAGRHLRVVVGGSTAAFADFAHAIAGKLPLFVGVIVAVSFVLLMALFGSLLIPLTAAAMNLLSAGAAFGVVTAVFQFGWGSSLIGIDSRGPIESFLPVLMFPILFGLSTDYELFLLARVHEEWRRRRANAAAIAHGLAATGGTITAAAAIMVLVFGAFVLGGQWVIALFGVALASAVALDAAVVRALLVPALMLLAGERNWELPRVLARALPRLRLEGTLGPESMLGVDAAGFGSRC